MQGMRPLDLRLQSEVTSGTEPLNLEAVGAEDTEAFDFRFWGLSKTDQPTRKRTKMLMTSQIKWHWGRSVW